MRVGLRGGLTVGVSQVRCSTEPGPPSMAAGGQLQERWAESGNQRFLRISQPFRNDSGPALCTYLLEVSPAPEPTHALDGCPFGLWLL